MGDGHNFTKKASLLLQKGGSTLYPLAYGFPGVSSVSTLTSELGGLQRRVPLREA